MPSYSIRLSAGVVVVRETADGWWYLLLRAFNHWDFPKGMVETGEEPFAAAVREVREESLIDDLEFEWGREFVETGPYSRGKVARYYVARTRIREVTLPIAEPLGRPEHNEYRWVDRHMARRLITPRLSPVLEWASGRIGETAAPARRIDESTDASGTSERTDASKEPGT